MLLAGEHIFPDPARALARQRLEVEYLKDEARAAFSGA